MPLTIPGSRFWFESLFRVRSDELPTGTDPEILTKYLPRKDVKDSAFFLVRKLPLSKQELPICVHWYYNHKTRGGGEMSVCSDFITNGTDYREAAVDLGIHSMTTGLTLDDGTVLLPLVASHTISFEVPLAKIPDEIVNRTDLGTAPVKTRTVLDDIIRGTPAALLNSDARMQTVLAGEIDYIDPEDANMTERIVHLRYRKR